jgi:hypothetical protein
MTFDTVTFAQLERLLMRLDFVPVPTRGPQLVFEHVRTQTEIVLPAGQPTEPAGSARLLGIRSTVVERGVVAGRVYDDLIAEIVGGGQGTSTSTSGSVRVSTP